MAEPVTVRTVSVRLRADFGQYTRSLGDSTAATVALRHEMESLARVAGTLDLPTKHAAQSLQEEARTAAEAATATSSLANQSEQANRATRTLGDGVDRAGAQMRQAGVDAGLLAHETDKAGTQMRESAVDADILAQELQKARRAAVELALTFAATGDSKALAAYKKNRTYLSDLERVAKALTPGDGGSGGGAEQAGQQSAQSFLKGFSQDFKALGGFREVITNPYVLAAMAPALIELGTAAGGLFLTGIGFAGIGAGIAGQIHDPQVARAAATLGNDVVSGFQKATASFATPIEVSLQRLDGAWQRLLPGLTSTFSSLAPVVTELTDGLIGAVNEALPGIERAVVAAEPLVQDVAQYLPNLGAQIGHLFGTVADNAGSLDDGLKLALGTLTALVATADTALNVFSKLFQVGEATTGTLDYVISLGDAGGHTATQFRYLTDQEKSAARGAVSAQPDFNALAKTLNTVTQNADTLAGAMVDKLVNSMLDTDNAVLHLAEAQTRLTDALKQNGHAYDLNKKAGQANREAILGVVQANLNEYDAMIKAGYSADQAAAAYDSNTAALERQLKKAGYNAREIDNLIGKYKQVPDKVDTDIALNGLTQAINDLNDLLRRLNGLPPLKTITVETIHVDRRTATYQRFGGVHYAADGLVSLGQAATYSSGTLYGFAEPGTGGEAFIPRNGDYERSMGILREAAAWYGARVAPASRGWDGAAAGAVDNSVNLTVQPQQANLSAEALSHWQRVAEVRQRTRRGR